MRIALIVAAALALGSSSASAVPLSAHPRTEAQAAGLGIRLLDAPVNRRDDPRARIYVVDHLAPGTTISRRFQVSDNTSGPLHPTLYVGGATIAAGTFKPSDKGEPSELGAWSSVAPTALDLKPGARATATVTIAVPADASAGERYGVVWAELPPSGGSGVKSVNRVGIRIYLSIGPGGEPASDFTVDTLQAVRRADGIPMVIAQVHNTGGRALDMSGSLKLSEGPSGLAAGPFPAKLGTTLLGGQTEPVTIPLAREITGGPWLATLDMTSGLIHRQVTGRITFPDRPSSAEEPVAATDVPLYKDKNTVTLFAAAMIGIIALLLLAFGLNHWLRRRRISS